MCFLTRTGLTLLLKMTDNAEERNSKPRSLIWRYFDKNVIENEINGLCKASTCKKNIKCLTRNGTYVSSRKSLAGNLLRLSYSISQLLKWIDKSLITLT